MTYWDILDLNAPAGYESESYDTLRERIVTILIDDFWWDSPRHGESITHEITFIELDEEGSIITQITEPITLERYHDLIDEREEL